MALSTDAEIVLTLLLALRADGAIRLPRIGMLQFFLGRFIDAHPALWTAVDAVPVAHPLFGTYVALDEAELAVSGVVDGDRFVIAPAAARARLADLTPAHRALCDAWVAFC